MPDILTIHFNKRVGLVEYTNPTTGARYIVLFTPNDNGLELANAGLGDVYIDANTTYTWEPEPIVVPPPLPTSARYKVIKAEGVNIRLGSGTSFKDIGDLALGQIVVIDNATKPGTRYLWGKIISIEAPTPLQIEMMRDYPQWWVAMQDGAAIWLELIPSA